MRNCTICGAAIRLSPSPEARAKKYGGKPSDYTNAFTTHASCAINKRAEEARALMARLTSRGNDAEADKTSQ
jgi:hypothetical protein